MTSWRMAVGAFGAVVVLVGCGGGDDAASPSAPAPATLAIAGSVSGTTTIAASLPPSTGAATAAPPPAPATTVPPTTVPATTVPPPPPPPPTPAPCGVVVVGDSVGQDLFNNGFGESLANVGCTLEATTGARGITMEQGAAHLARARDIPANVAVVLLGYHNAVSQTRSGTFPALIDGVMEAAGDRIVVWSLPGRTPDCGPSFSNAVVRESELVHEAMGRWPNLVPVDYPAIINAHPEYSQNRCPHLVNSGSRAVGAWLAGEVRQIVDASS